MTIADRIVDKLLEGDPDMGDLVRRTFQLDTADVDYDFRFGFEITTNIDKEIAEERGYELGFDVIGQDLVMIERNIIRTLHRIGVDLSDQGHADDALVGSGSINFDPANNPKSIEGMKFLKAYIDRPGNDEPLSTGCGSIPNFIHNEMFNGVRTEVVKDCADVSIMFYDLYSVAGFFDFLSDGLDPYDAVQELIRMGESFLGAPEPSGVFKSTLGGQTVFSAKCPACGRKHGNFRTFEQASGNKMCRYCIRSYVDKIKKVRETGNYKTLLNKKNHAKARR